MVRLLVGLVVGAVSVLLLTASLGPVAEGTSQLTTRSGSQACDYSDVHNTAKIQVTAEGTVVAGQRLNGTGGAVWFTGLPKYPPYGIHEVRLVGPSGESFGPLNPIGPNVIFDHIPLCHEGRWTLKEHPSNRTLTRFHTTTNALVPGPSTVLLDNPVDRPDEPSYRRGEVFVSDGYAICDWDNEDTSVTRSPGTKTTNVTTDWIVESPGPEEALITLRVGGEEGSYLTSVRVEDWGNGSISAFPTWRSPGVYEVVVTGWGVEDGFFWSLCTEGRFVSVGPYPGTAMVP